MQLVDRIEKRRFVGREFVLWLWFEGELFDETLFVQDHGEVGLAIEKEIVLSSGKEVTRIQGKAPARAREAKEALSLGKLPERASFRLVLEEREATFSLKADTLGMASAVLPTTLEEGDEPAPGELGAETKRPPRRRRSSVEEDAEREADARAEVFYDRIDRLREVESILRSLYRDFLRLRLGPAWESLVVPAMRRWVADQSLDAEGYREARTKALAPNRQPAGGKKR